MLHLVAIAAPDWWIHGDYAHVLGGEYISMRIWVRNDRYAWAPSLYLIVSLAPEFLLYI